MVLIRFRLIVMKTLLNEIVDGKYNFEDTPAVIERLSKITEVQN